MSHSLRGDYDPVPLNRDEEVAEFVDCPACDGSIAPEPLPDGRPRCDNCGGVYEVSPEFHARAATAPKGGSI